MSVQRSINIVQQAGGWMLALLVSMSAAGCQLARSQTRDTAAAQKQRVGWVEAGQIAESGSTTEFKLDTGANTTSINAEILAKPADDTEVGGMVRFRFVDGDSDGQVFERPVVEWVRIKDGAGGFFRRPVVIMLVCVAGQWIEAEVNLADRTQFDYSVLIGRNMLKAGGLVVDSAEKNIATAECPDRSGASS